MGWRSLTLLCLRLWVTLSLPLSLSLSPAMALHAVGLPQALSRRPRKHQETPNLDGRLSQLQGHLLIPQSLPLPGVGPGPARQGCDISHYSLSVALPVSLSPSLLLCLVPEPGLSTSQIRLIRSWQERWWRCQPVNKSQPSASRQPAAPEEDPLLDTQILIGLVRSIKIFTLLGVLSAPSLVRPWPLGTPGPY